MDVLIESYIITEAQKNSRSWNPTAYLNAAPYLVAHGEATGKYVIAIDLNDSAYDDTKTWLEANAEKYDIATSNLYPPWEVGISVEVDERYGYAGDVYSVIQAHTTQVDWYPPIVPALFKKETPDGVIGEWTQPAGAHDAYEKYAVVTHNGSTWESQYDANVWAPGVFGWLQI
jgi:hypothetical protein